MKKALIITNLITIAILLWILLRPLQKLPAGCNTCTNICMDYTGTKFHRFDTAVLRQMARSYRESAAGANNQKKLNQQDAFNIWFSLDTLKHFIWEIESTVCQKACKETNRSALGIRIYYARYPDSVQMKNTAGLQDVPPAFQFSHTLFMVPTYDAGSSGEVRHTDFDPSKTDSTGCHFSAMESLPEAMALTYSFRNAVPNSGNTNAQNHGGLCPPLVCTGAAFQK